jgi:hypothetical protein
MIKFSRILMFLFTLFMTLPVMHAAVPLDDRDVVLVSLYPDVDVATAQDPSSLEGDDACDTLCSCKGGPAFVHPLKTGVNAGAAAFGVFPLWRPPMATVS